MTELAGRSNTSAYVQLGVGTSRGISLVVYWAESAGSHRLVPRHNMFPCQSEQPVVKVRLHSTSDACSRSALLLPQIKTIFPVDAPSPRTRVSEVPSA
jgi:hypothetical protein